MLAAVHILLAQTERFAMRDADLTLHGAYVPTEPRAASPAADGAAHKGPVPHARRPFTVAFDVVQVLRAVPCCVEDWTTNEHERACLSLVSVVLLRHAQTFLCLLAGPHGADDAAVAGSHRVNFVVWGALHLFKGFLAENAQDPSGSLSPMAPRLEALRLWFDDARVAPRRSPLNTAQPRPVLDLVADPDRMAEAYAAFAGDGRADGAPSTTGALSDAMVASATVFDAWFHTVLDPILQSIATTAPPPPPPPPSATDPIAALGAWRALSPSARGAWLAAEVSTTALAPVLEAASRALSAPLHTDDDDEYDKDNDDNDNDHDHNTGSHLEIYARGLSYALDEVLQVVPTLAAELETAQTPIGRLGGFWHPTRRVTGAVHGLGGAWYNPQHPFRWFVDVPGLSMAATVVQSAAADGPAPASAPEEGTTGSTLLFVPPLAEWPAPARRLGWLDASVLDAHRVRCGAGAERGVATGPQDALCAQLPTTALAPVALLLLFSALPDGERVEGHDGGDEDGAPLGLRDVQAFICASLRTAPLGASAEAAASLVVIVVQSVVDKHTARLIEAWPLPQPGVRLLVVSAVGEWTLTQLCVRFQVLPNSPYTSPASTLRCVWDSARVLVALLDRGQKPQGPHGQRGITEQWARYMVVIGGREDEPAVTTAAETSTRRTRATETLMRPPSSSSSSSDDDDEPSDTRSSDDDDTCSCAHQRLSEKPEASTRPLPPALPLCGAVTRSVWLGGRTELAQLEAYHYFGLFRRRQVRERLLPSDARHCVSATRRDNVELRLLAALDDRGVSGQGATLDSVALLQTRLERHLRHTLHTRLLSELMAAGDAPHVAWQRLTQWESAHRLHASEPAPAEVPASADEDDLTPAMTTELLLDIRCAYWSMLQCAAELCRTVVVDEEGVCHVLS